MKVFIYYFTGTGNSLLVARKIAEHLDGAVLRPVMELFQSEVDEVSTASTLLDAHAIGFVFPVYFDRIPQIIRKAIEKSQFDKTQYFFTVATCGEQAGNALFELDSVLRHCGVRLDYGKNIDMADNSIMVRTSKTKTAMRLIQMDKAVDEIADAVINGIKMEKAFKHSNVFSIMGRISRFVVVHYFKAEKRRVDVARCSLCGMCTNICPVGNISIEGQKVIIRDNCQWCFACINWCQKNAIIFGKIDPLKRHQYHSPGINAADIVHKSNR